MTDLRNSIRNVSSHLLTDGLRCVPAQEEEEEEDNRLSLEAEHQFNQRHAEEEEEEEEEERGRDSLPLSQRPTAEQPAASFVNISFELDPEPAPVAPDTSRVPAPLSS